MNALANTNVIQFPTDRIVRIHTKQGFNEELTEHKLRYVNHVVYKHMNKMYLSLGLDGIDIEKGKFYDDFMFAAEALKSAIMRTVGLPHEIQDAVDNSLLDISDEPLIERIQLINPENGMASNDNDDPDGSGPTGGGSPIALRGGAQLAA